MRGVISGVLQALASLFCFIEVVSATTHTQSGCYNTDVMLSCPHYTQNKPGRLVWRSYNKTGSTWTDIGSMTNGNPSLISTNLDSRIAIHSNGSLQISSLQPDDETLYQCKAYVEGAGLDVHVTDLKVSCGTTVKTTAGRVAMTTPIIVSMETTTPTLLSRASNSLVHWNQTWLLYAIIGLALIGIVRCD